MSPRAGPPCEGGYPESSTVVTCPRRKVDVVVVELGDGQRLVQGRGDIRFDVDGDMGDDEIKGGDANDDLFEGESATTSSVGTTVADDSSAASRTTGSGKDGRSSTAAPGKDRCEGGEQDKC